MDWTGDACAMDQGSLAEIGSKQASVMRWSSRMVISPAEGLGYIRKAPAVRWRNARGEVDAKLSQTGGVGREDQEAGLVLHDGQVKRGGIIDALNWAGKTSRVPGPMPSIHVVGAAEIAGG